MRTRWTKSEVELLETNYSSLTIRGLECIIPRTRASINLKAASLGLRKIYDGPHPNVEADLSVLLEDTPTAYYWIGFLAADGCFGTDYLSLGLADLDYEHLVAFCNFIKHSIPQSAEVKVQDKWNVPKIKNKFDLKTVKTYNPPKNPNWMFGDLFIAFVIGFVDGDGHVQKMKGRNDCQISIKLHSSWLSFLQFVSDGVADIVGTKPNLAKINSRGYARIIFSNGRIVKFLKLKTICLSLPVLTRKWSKIDEKLVGRQERGKIHLDKVVEFLKLGMKQTLIAKELGISDSAVCNIIKRNGLQSVSCRV